MFKKNTYYKYLEHTADAKFEAYGKTLEEAFKNSVLATYNIIVDTDKVTPLIKKEIAVSAKREISLLYDFIEEFLFLLDTENFLLNKVESLTIKKDNDSFVLNAVVFGDYHFDDNNVARYDVDGNLKSVTYNDMSIKKTITNNNDFDNGNLFVITVVIDL